MREQPLELLDAIATHAAKGKRTVVKLNKFAAAERVARYATNLTEMDRVLSLEFLAGTQFSDASSAAFDLQCLSGMAIRFRFNGVEVSLTRITD